jgi:inorganic pyrophosphatase
MHPWHDVTLDEDLSHSFRAVIETPRASRVQYAIDLPTGVLRVRRVLFSAVQYPAHYGFIPRTLADDGEPLDALVLGQEQIAPLSIVRARAIGVLLMVQGGKRDDKILAVHVDDPVFGSYRTRAELPPYQLAELEKFFNDYRALENIVVWCGYEDADAATARIRELAARYEAHGQHGRAAG